MRLKAILTLLTTLALASGDPDQWKLDMQDAAQAGYQSWLLDNISELFGFNFNFGGRRRQGSPSLEKPDSAVEEAMCTADGCSRPTSFELAAEAQSKAIIKKKARLLRRDVSRAVPSVLVNASLSKVHAWLDKMDGGQGRPPSPEYNPTMPPLDPAAPDDAAYKLMSDALRNDPFATFEAVPVGKGADVRTVLVIDRGFEQALDLESRAPVPSYKGRRLAEDDDNKRRLSIYPSGAPYTRNDDRSEVLYPNNLYWGWSTLVSTGNRVSPWCSGTMISPTVLLTAAHCVAAGGSADWADGTNWLTQPQICVRDAQRTTPTAADPTDENCVSNGGILATWRKMTTFVKWTRDWDSDWDVAWITLTAPVGYTSGWKGIRTDSVPYPAGTILNVAGYGGDCPAGGDCSDHIKTMGCQIESSCTNNERYYYKCDTIGGMSGSGAYLYYPSLPVPDNRVVIGVHAYGFNSATCGPFNRAVRIRPNMLAAMCSTTDDMLCF